MKKRGRMGVGMLSASVMIMGVYAATHLTQLTTEQTNFTSYAASTTSPKLTQSMWNGLVNKLDTLAQNHEERIRALENAPAPVVPVAPTPGPDLNCKPQRFEFRETIKFTTFEITEDLKNGQSRRLHPVTADIAKIKKSKYPNGIAPTWTIEVRCDRGVLKLVNSSNDCQSGTNGKIYADNLGTCALASNRCIQEASKQLGGTKRDDLNTAVDSVDDRMEGDPTSPVRCHAIRDEYMTHGYTYLLKGDGYRYPSSGKPCYNLMMCDNGEGVQIGVSQGGEI